MSDDLIDRARAALDGVTPGPWVHDPKLFSNVYSDDATGSIVATCTGFTYARRPPAVEAANARFIAFARSLVPEMADEIARLRAEVERLREAERTAWIAGRDAAAKECNMCPDQHWGPWLANRIICTLTPVAHHD
jgi:hypothetical protein